MRSKAENFAFCTNSEFLILGVDESGMCHHWETEGMGRFIQDPQIQDAMFQVVCQNHGAPLPDLMAEEASITQVAAIKAARLAGQKQQAGQQVGIEQVTATQSEEAEHLRSLLRQKIHCLPLPDGSPRVYGEEEHRPPEWLAAVPFIEPSQLDHGTLLAVLQQFVAFEHAYANAQDHMGAGMGGQDPNSVGVVGVHGQGYHPPPGGIEGGTGYSFGEGSYEGVDQGQYAQQAYPHQQAMPNQPYDAYPGQHYEQQQYEQQFQEDHGAHQIFSQQQYEPSEHPQPNGARV